ncbi:MAG: galactose-6-phosphate isomerase subunit LacA [Candidatus Tyloplasma litorale]|nr:MAG: galactose-6-phosphate isomerase subunit LacA [Mycoplasmatales bacterium]
MKYYILSTEIFEKYSIELNEYMQNELNVNVELIIENDNLSYIKKAVELSKKIVEDDRYKNSLILIDETGGLGFAAAAKVKGMICAQISDEHSSHMTREHNGAVGIALGGNISHIHQIKAIIKLFVEEKFAAGRHMVRIDMLDEMA